MLIHDAVSDSLKDAISSSNTNISGTGIYRIYYFYLSQIKQLKETLRDLE